MIFWLQNVFGATEGGVGTIFGGEASGTGVDGFASDVRDWRRDGAGVGHVGGGRPYNSEYVPNTTANILQRPSIATNFGLLLELSPLSKL